MALWSLGNSSKMKRYIRSDYNSNISELTNNRGHKDYFGIYRGKDTLDNPLPLAPDELMKAMFTFDNYANLVEGATYEEDVPIDEVGTTQTYIYRKGLEQYKDVPLNDLDADEITAYKYNGVYYIIDGNHRAVAALWRGKPTLHMIVTDVFKEDY